MRKENYKSMNRFRFIIPLITFHLLSACSNTPGDSHDSNPQQEENNLAQVVVLLGQSNMEGHTYSTYLSKTMSNEYNKYIAGYDDVQISFHNSGGYTSNKQFTNTKLGQGKSINHFGPEVGIAETVHAASKENVFLVKYAQGATSLSGHWLPPSSSSSGRAGTLYSGAVDYIFGCMDQLENMGYYPEIKAICWMQGEDDSNGNQYNNYYVNTKNFISDLRKDLALYMDLDGIGFLDAAIASIDVWQQHQIINSAKERNAEEDELSDYIDTNLAGLHTNYEPVGAVDIYHYDSDCMIKLGRLFGEVLVDKYLD